MAALPHQIFIFYNFVFAILADGDRSLQRGRKIFGHRRSLARGGWQSLFDAM